MSNSSDSKIELVKDESGGTLDTQPLLLKISAYKDVIEVVGKSSVVILGIAYVVGLLVLNFHLREYGINYLGLLQIEYILAGFLWIFLTGAIFCFGYTLIGQLKETYRDRKRNFAVRLAMLAAILAGQIFSIFYILNALGGSRLDFDTKSGWIVLSILIFNAFSLKVSSDIIRKKYREIISAGENKSRRWAGIYDIVYFLVPTLLSFSLYAAFVFPKLSPVFGGGRKQLVNFVIKAERIPFLELVGLRPNAETKIFEALEVVFESDKAYIIALPEEYTKNTRIKAVKINKDDVELAVYLYRNKTD